MHIRPLCNNLDKTLYHITFACRFWRSKQVIVSEQTRLCALCWLAVLPRSFQARQSCVHRASKKCICDSKQEPGLQRIRYCMVLHRSKVMVLMRCTLFFTYDI